MTERRRWLRFETALNALCEIVHEKKKETSQIKNISKDGALLILTKPLRPGTELVVSMDIPGDNIPVLASCEVAWQKEEDAAQKNQYETGVKFVRLEGADRGRLLEYIYSQWLSLLDKIP